MNVFAQSKANALQAMGKGFGYKPLEHPFGFAKREHVLVQRRKRKFEHVRVGGFLALPQVKRLHKGGECLLVCNLLFFVLRHGAKLFEHDPVELLQEIGTGVRAEQGICLRVLAVKHCGKYVKNTGFVHASEYGLGDGVFVDAAV